jgi:hypothetical protein
MQRTLREHSGNIQGTFRGHSGDIQGTFRERSGNIQVTFRERSGNVQGTFREHPVRVELDASDPPSQLQEALTKSTKVDAEYITCPHGYVRRGFTFREHSWNIHGTFMEHSWNIHGTFMEHSGRVERTPVSLHPTCKKHLKKKSTKGLMQNTTCKHEYLRRGLTRPNDVSQE